MRSSVHIQDEPRASPPPLLLLPTHRLSNANHSIERDNVGVFKLSHEHSFLPKLDPLRIAHTPRVETLESYVCLQFPPRPDSTIHGSKLPRPEVSHALKSVTTNVLYSNCFQLLVEVSFLGGWRTVGVQAKVDVPVLILNVQVEKKNQLWLATCMQF